MVLLPLRMLFLSTLSLRRATLSYFYIIKITDISIHALLAESDAVTTFGAGSVRDFYPRSPCGERLTHPLLCNVKSDFYPRSPCGERQLAARDDSIMFVFLSTLSLRRATVGRA